MNATEQAGRLYHFLFGKEILHSDRQNWRAVTLTWENSDVFRVQPPSLHSDWHSWLAATGRRFLLFARDQTRTEADAHDVLQEALVESWRRHGHDLPPEALVFATIRRRAIDLSRRNTRREVREQSRAPDWFITPADEPSDDPGLEEAVKQLSPELREVVVLKIWSGLTFREIGETLSVPQNTAASRYRYALEKLRSLLKEVPS